MLISSSECAVLIYQLDVRIHTDQSMSTKGNQIIPKKACSPHERYNFRGYANQLSVVGDSCGVHWQRLLEELLQGLLEGLLRDRMLQNM